MDHAMLMDYLLENAEERAVYFLDRQYGEESPYSGAVPAADRFAPPEVRNTSIPLLELITLWLYPVSRFYANPEIPISAERALTYLKRVQRPSGNMDLSDCNFDSPPDSGFFLWDLIPLYRLLEKPGALNPGTALPAEITKAAAVLLGKVKELIMPALEGIRTGGFHTANHRWVLASSLTAGYKLTGNEAYLERARQYLAEGLDCNEDGEYSERSAIYNAVNNEAMIMLFEELGDKKYLSYVQRNLKMMVIFFEDDGSLFTGNSTRQDRGKKMYGGYYFYQYLYIAHHLEDEEAAKMAAFIASDFIKSRRQGGPSCLPSMLLRPVLKFPAEQKKAFTLPDYNRYLKSSGVVRYKKGKFSFSLLHDNPTWLCFNHGTLSAYCRASFGYFHYGNATIKNLETLKDCYRFSFRAEGWYFEPLEKPASDLVNFRTEDHSVRRRQYPNYTELQITVRFPGEGRENGIDISFAATGINGVHYCFEFVLPAGIPVSGDHFTLLPKPGDYILLKNGGITLRDNTSCLSIRGGFADTDLFATSRNSAPRSQEGFTLYMNGTSPFSRTVSIN